MPNEILIYGSIESYSSAEFIKQMNEVSSDGDLVVRVNTNGGNPEYGFGMAAKFREHGGKKLVKVDGKAFSFGMFFLAYADEVEALDVSEFLIHRAAYPDWFERSEFFTDELRGNLERVNQNLKKAIEAKIDVKKFEELKGVKMKDVFSMDSRLDVFLSAKEAKDIGLVDSVVKLTPSKKAEIETFNVQMAAKYGVDSPKKETKNNLKIENKMTIEEFKSNHPELYAQVFNLGSEAGVTAERDRVGSWLAFVDIDAEAVANGIKEGKTLSATAMAEFSRKQFSKDKVDSAAADSAAAVETDRPDDETAEAKALKDFETKLDEHLKK